MSDLDIGKTLQKEEELEKEATASTPEANQFTLEKDSPPDGKNILLLIGIIAGIFFLFFSGALVYNKITGANILSLDDLHQKNLAGDLDEKGVEGYVYNGYSFIKTDGLWWTEMNKFGTLLKVPLHFGPQELENIPIEGELDPQFNEGEVIHIAIDPEVRNKYYTLAVSELSFNVVKGLDRLPEGSCTTENWACENRTIISCNHSQGKPVIELTLTETGGPKIEMFGTCIKLSGSQDYDIVKAANRLLYQWYGVMK